MLRSLLLLRRRGLVRRASLMSVAGVLPCEGPGGSVLRGIVMVLDHLGVIVREL